MLNLDERYDEGAKRVIVVFIDIDQGHLENYKSISLMEGVKFLIVSTEVV